MEYTEKEKQALTILGKTDFKNISKSEALSLVSKLGEMRPEVAAQALAQFPEFARLVKSSLSDYREIIERIVSSDDDSLHQIYGLSTQEMQAVETSKKQLHELAARVQADLSKCLDKKELSENERQDIISREMDILRLVAEKDTEMRSQQRETVREAYQKDSEKRHFNWGLIGGISFVVLSVVGVGASVLSGGKFDFHWPKKHK